MPAFCAVPSNTPINRNGVRLVPSAGPYYVASYTPGQGVALLRNPNYHGTRPRHFARIELGVGIPAQRAVNETEAGSTDYTVLGLDSSPYTSTISPLAARLAARYGPGSAAATHGAQRYFVNPTLELDSFVLNTHRPLFSDVRLRQAVNYAIDRRSLAGLGSGAQPLPERPTDHYLPPGIPGFHDAPVYPMTPDLAKARQLVRLAHAGDRTAVLYALDTPPGPEQAQIVKNNLAAIGIQVQIKTFPTATMFSRIATPGEPFDLGYSGWVADYPDPIQILNPLIENSSVAPTLDDPAYRRRLAGARALTGPERYLTYGGLDLALARSAAPLAAFGIESSHDLFSARIGCQTFGIYGTDLAALCIKRTHG
jgi:ABC-type transport system substrate-binding protein